MMVFSMYPVRDVLDSNIQAIFWNVETICFFASKKKIKFQYISLPNKSVLS